MPGGALFATKIQFGIKEWLERGKRREKFGSWSMRTTKGVWVWTVLRTTTMCFLNSTEVACFKELSFFSLYGGHGDWLCWKAVSFV